MMALKRLCIVQEVYKSGTTQRDVIVNSRSRLDLERGSCDLGFVIRCPVAEKSLSNCTKVAGMLKSSGRQ